MEVAQTLSYQLKLANLAFLTFSKDVVRKVDPNNTAWSGLTYCRVDSICIPCV